MMSNAVASKPVATGTEPIVIVDRPQAGVALITLNRPSARNALSLEMIGELHATIDRLGADTTLSAIVLAANGPVFSSGHDLKELTAHRSDGDAGLAFYTHTMTACSEMMQAIVACPKPVIAAVHGTATAAGCQLVATCDLAVASQDAKFCTPGVNIGLFCSTPMVALSRNLSHKHALEFLLSGDLFSAADAARVGLINRAVPEAELDRTVDELARKIASKSPLTLAVGKEAFYRQAELSLDEAYAYTADVMVKNLEAADAKEGINAFVEKRTPVWCGR